MPMFVDVEILRFFDRWTFLINTDSFRYSLVTNLYHFVLFYPESRSLKLYTEKKITLLAL